MLAMDAVQKVGNGHPSTAMSLAPVAYLLFQKWLSHDPGDPQAVPDQVIGHPLKAHWLRAGRTA
jgi:transketolase